MYSLKSRSLQWHKIGTNVLLNNHLYSAILSIKNDLALKCLHYRSQWLPKSFSSLESCLDSFRPFPLSSSSSSLSTMFQNTGDLCNIIAMHLKDQASLNKCKQEGSRLRMYLALHSNNVPLSQSRLMKVNTLSEL